MNNREQFIAKMRADGCPDTWTFQDDGTGGFHNHATEWAWIAWNRAIESQAAQIAALTAELELRRKSGSASDRLHNLCEGISRDADGSEWSREEWERLDAEMLALKAANKALTAERDALRQQLNTPELHNFANGVALEASHQRDRWGSKHDAGKQPEDWFWLLGYLAGKALAAAKSGNTDKALHHCISSAAALANWHAALAGNHTDMRPGIDPVERGIDAARTQAHKEPKDAQG